MSRSRKTFDRWIPREVSSWPYQVFKSHERELYRMYWAFQPTVPLTYSQLGTKGAQWGDAPGQHLKFDDKQKAELFTDLKDWSGGFNEFQNWTNLNALLSLASYLETYIASTVSLALESDIGIIYGAPRSIDGVALLKHGDMKRSNISDLVTGCVKGDWNSRVSAYKSLFGKIPNVVESNISDLEAMRTLRNKVGHAFGRDIEDSRRKGIRKTAAMERLSTERLNKLQRLGKKVAAAIDSHLFLEHVAEFETVYFYHKLLPSLPRHVHPNQRAVLLKKEIGRFGAQSAGKDYCSGLVAYYEAL